MSLSHDHGHIQSRGLLDDRFRLFLDGKKQAASLCIFSHRRSFSFDQRHTDEERIPSCSSCSLSISPDIVWATIMQGVSAHVDTDPEKFRHVFVSHSGQKDLVVRDDTLKKGSWNNGWKAVIENFSQQIASHLDGPLPKSTLGMTFTTTKSVEKVAHIMTKKKWLSHFCEQSSRQPCWQIGRSPNFFITIIIVTVTSATP